MMFLLKEPISDADFEKVQEDLQGYIKFVVDVERGVGTAGGMRHVDGEAMLLEDGSKQEHLWGGGLDAITNDLDFDSMINIRPSQDNPSREVLAQELRKKIEAIARKLLR